MSIHIIGDDYETVATISSGAVKIFLSLTKLVEIELNELNSGFSSIQSDEIQIDKDVFILFVDTFFKEAEYNGKYMFFAPWAEVVAGIYESITDQFPRRKMLNVEHFKPRKFT